MAKYSVEFSCGHTETVQLFGKTSERDRKIEWYENHGCCSACYAAKKDAERKAANDAASEKSAELALPELTGSEKQIAWANTIRVNELTEFDERSARVLKKVSVLSPAAQQEILDAILLQRSELVAKTEAKFWIDNRDGQIRLNQQRLLDASPTAASEMQTAK